MGAETSESNPEIELAATVDTPTVRGRIIVSRHGRPALNRSAGPRLTWQEYEDWWQRYEEGSLAQDQEPKPKLVQAVSEIDHVMSSERPRAIETAKWATGGREPETDSVFNEAPLPPPTWKSRTYLPKTWNILARTFWLFGHSLGGESVDEARERAKLAAERLHHAAEGRTVYLAAHGWFNRMLRRPLKHLGWVCVRDGGDKYWSYRVYEYRGN